MRITLRVPNHPTPMAIVERGIRETGFRVRWRDGEGGARWAIVDVPDDIASLNRMLAVGQRLNSSLMRAALARGVRIPSVYELHKLGQLAYVPEPPGREFWQTWLDNLVRRDADCEDLAMHEASRNEVLFNNGARAECIRSSPRVYHAIVRHVDGRIEDPSMPLGLWKYRLERKLRRERKRLPPWLANLPRALL